MYVAHSHQWHFSSRTVILGGWHNAYVTKKYLLPPHGIENHISNCIKRMGFLLPALMALLRKAWPEWSCVEVNKITTLVYLGDKGSYWNSFSRAYPNSYPWTARSTCRYSSVIMCPLEGPVARSEMSPDGPRKTSQPLLPV